MGFLNATGQGNINIGLYVIAQVIFLRDFGAVCVDIIQLL
jgi:hypothetical protein